MINTVNEYIENAPIDARAKLYEMRSIIRASAPDAEEKISYGMPYYGLNGRLVYFRLAKNHIGLYIPPPIIANFKDDLKNYVTAISTIQFPLDQPLPKGLIRKLIFARVKYNKDHRK